MAPSHLRITGLVSMAGLIALTACSSTSTSTSASSGSSGGSGSSAALSSCVAHATQNIATVKASLPLKAPPSPIPMKKNAGKTIWLVSATQDEFNQTVANGFITAAKAAGMTGRYVQANGQVNQMGQLVQEAVSAKANGIVLFNIDPHTVWAHSAPPAPPTFRLSTSTTATPLIRWSPAFTRT